MQELTTQEQLFIDRIGLMMTTGLDFEAACQAVLADDRRLIGRSDDLELQQRVSDCLNNTHTQERN